MENDHSFGCEVPDQPPNLVRSDLSLNDYDLFSKLKKFLGVVRVDSDKELKSTGLKSMVTNFYDEGEKAC